jgi:hypothetical protein
MHGGENRKIRKRGPLVNSACTLPVAPGREVQAQFCPALRGKGGPVPNYEGRSPTRRVPYVE